MVESLHIINIPMDSAETFKVIPDRYQLTGRLGGGEVDICIVDGVCRLRVTAPMVNKKGQIVHGQLYTQLNKDQYEKLDEYLGSGSGIPVDAFMLELNTNIGLDRQLTEVIQVPSLSQDHHQTEL